MVSGSGMRGQIVGGGAIGENEAGQTEGVAMMQVLRSILTRLARFVLSLRYRVHLHGGEVLPTLKGPVLLLPNHPAYVDPVLFLITFYPALQPRIVFSEENFPQAIVAPLTKLLNGISIPALGRQSQEARSENGPRVAVEGVDQGRERNPGREAGGRSSCSPRNRSRSRTRTGCWPRPVFTASCGLTRSIRSIRFRSSETARRTTSDCGRWSRRRCRRPVESLPVAGLARWAASRSPPTT